MIDKHVILSRNSKLIIKVYIINFFIILMLVLYGINTIKYQTFFHIHSVVVNINSEYYIEVLVPVNDVNEIINKNKLLIASKEYDYQIYKIIPKVKYQNQTNYQKLYLKIVNLEKKYQLDGYQIEIKIKKENKKIIEYFKNKKEDNNGNN